MKHRIIPAIMSGGAGTRLWPASTDEKPKQFHALVGEGSLIQETLARVQGETEALHFLPPIILANARHAEIVSAHTKSFHPAAIVLEPMGRNTAATGAVAAAIAQDIAPDALVLLLPADHQIADQAAFLAAIERAAPLARERIVTFGVAPNRPATGYGYIKRGPELAPGVYEIDSFREKPDEATARGYIEEGGYSWNAGIFFFHPRVLLEEFFSAADVRDDALAALAEAKRDGVFITLDADLFSKTRSVALDVAVMEKTRRGAVAPCDIGWADVGAWDEIWRLAPQDAFGNAAQGRVVALDSNNNYLRSDGPKICVSGVDDLIVIATADAIVIVPRARAQDVKMLRDAADKI